MFMVNWGFGDSLMKGKIKSIAMQINPSTGTPIVFDFFKALTLWGGINSPFVLLWGEYDSLFEWLPYFGLFPVSVATFVTGDDYWNFELKCYHLLPFSAGLVFYALALEEDLSYEYTYGPILITGLFALSFCLTWYLLIFSDRSLPGESDTESNETMTK